ncbi:MAG: CDGSH iron-sulfur domain-containing protein [Gammaproteobacteria bacterium]|nr:CDGSH iron-sulfur domain-containing protein [Gammaproteobacteria bacterium]
MGSQSVTIKSAPGGPYIVKNLHSFSNRNGAIESKEAMALCRCGQSANKPFCDGTHKTIGFSSENQLDPEKDRLDTYRGKKITIHDNRSLCAHAGYCTDGLASVFHLREKPFVDPDGASAEEIIEVVKQCPSGALSYSIEYASETLEISEASIFIAPNGPYVVKGRVDLLETTRGKGASETSITLCRCGASKNKPYCDGSHWDVKFTDDDN